MRKLSRAIFVVALALAARIAVAQTTDYLPAEDESASFTVEAVLSGLDNPWGMVIRAGRDPSGPHELFIAESGAGTDHIPVHFSISRQLNQTAAYPRVWAA